MAPANDGPGLVNGTGVIGGQKSAPQAIHSARALEREQFLAQARSSVDKSPDVLTLDFKDRETGRAARRTAAAAEHVSAVARVNFVEFRGDFRQEREVPAQIATARCRHYCFGDQATTFWSMQPKMLLP